MNEDFGEFEAKNNIEINDNFNKINPDYYIHLCYIKCINALDSDDLNVGMIKLMSSVNMLEVLARNGRTLPTNYNEELDKIKETDETKKAIKKLGIISKYIFSSRANFSSLSDNK